MKKTFILIYLSLTTISAYGAAKKETVLGTGSLSTQNLRCVVSLHTDKPQLKDKIATEVSGDSQYGISIIHNSTAPRLIHRLARSEGCQIKELEKIIKDSVMSYSFIQTKIKLIKETSPSSVNGYGQCVALYSEEMSLDLGQGIVLKSNEAKLIAMNDCR